MPRAHRGAVTVLNPNPDPDPDPDPNPIPNPNPNPDPEPDPEPDPTPNPDPGAITVLLLGNCGAQACTCSAQCTRSAHTVHMLACDGKSEGKRMRSVTHARPRFDRSWASGSDLSKSYRRASQRKRSG